MASPHWLPLAGVKRLLALQLAIVQICPCFPAPGRTPGREEPPPAVNGTAPNVVPSTPSPRFSWFPTDDEITRSRALGAPILPVRPSAGLGAVFENRALARALEAYARRDDPEDASPLTEFLRRYPASSRRPALLLGLGGLYRRTGRYTLAQQSWEEAWRLTRNGTSDNEKQLANWAAGELAEVHGHLGHAARLQTLFAELNGREIHGPATEQIAGARESMWLREHRPEMSFRCGPLALAAVRARLGMPPDSRVIKAPVESNGMSLAGLAGLAAETAMPMQAAKREPGAEIAVPSVVHWTVDHYTAIVEHKIERGKDYYLVVNPSFEKELWVSRAVLESETSGYDLIPAGALRAGWRPVGRDEAATVWGRCFNGSLDLSATRSHDDQVGGDCSRRGLAQYRFHTLLASLNITDEPLGYAPPLGPAVRFGITYNQREANQPAVFAYSNLGPKWTFDWMSYVSVISSGSYFASVYLRSGGLEQYVGSSNNSDGRTIVYNNDYMSHAQLVWKLTTDHDHPYFERHLPDGTVEIFDLADSDPHDGFRVFMTRIVDRAGNTVKIAYDQTFRIVSVTDALGQVTKVSYDLASDPLKITKVTDPFGRSAALTYDFQGHLTAVTDVMGMTSQFSYVNGDFISGLTTPYGTTTFRTGGLPGSSYPDVDRSLEATDANGDTEHLELRFSLPVPATPNVADTLGGSLYWDKLAWAAAPNDTSQATLIQWMIDNHAALGLRHYVDSPLVSQRRYFYGAGAAYQPNYSSGPGETEDGNTSGDPNFIGMPVRSTQPLADGTMRTLRTQYNSWGFPTQTVDAAGRTMQFDYDSTGMDLLEIHNAFRNTTVARLTYNAQHLPLTYTDAAGQTTSYTYNPQGQLLTLTNSRQEVTAFTYDARGYMTRIAGPFPGATATFAYDAAGRLQSTTDSEGYQTLFAYDALDRLIQSTYPDGTFEQTDYDRLDPAQYRDRLGRTTQTAYDALERPVSITDPLGQTTQMAWCSCGNIAQLTDANGNVTTWNRDIKGRVVSKILADGSATQYQYDSALGRLTQVADAKGQVTSYQYNPDGTLQQIGYSDAGTAGVSFTYDPNWPRLTSQTDGAGTTTYSYQSPGSPGALRVSAITGVWGETTAYSYDELGRIVGRSIDGIAVAHTYDSLDNVTSESSPLGRTAFSYLRATGRLQSMLLPNGQSTTLTYFDNKGDRRLQQIKNLAPDGSLLSQFDQTYAATGEIQTQTRQIATLLGGAPTGYQFAYDAAAQLSAAVLGVSDGTVTGAFNYAYDPAGNRTLRQANDNVATSTFNNLNEIADPSYVYDANGNLTSDGNRSFEWDTENRLTAVVAGTHRSEFTYDALSRLTRIVEKDSGAVVGDKHLIWCGASICEERDVANGLTKRFFTSGEVWSQNGADTLYFYTRDRLGSIREMTDASGAVVAGYDYDPWGRAVSLGGSIDAAFGYAGYYVHAPSGLYLTQYRAYDPNLGRWLSRDPVGETGDETNLYRYAGGNPVNRVDPRGLGWQDWLGDRRKDVIEWAKDQPREKFLEFVKNPTPINGDTLSKQAFLAFAAPEIQRRLNVYYDAVSAELLPLESPNACLSEKDRKRRDYLRRQRGNIASAIQQLHIVYTQTYDELQEFAQGSDNLILSPQARNFTY